MEDLWLYILEFAIQTNRDWYQCILVNKTFHRYGHHPIIQSRLRISTGSPDFNEYIARVNPKLLFRECKASCWSVGYNLNPTGLRYITRIPSLRVLELDHQRSLNAFDIQTIGRLQGLEELSAPIYTTDKNIDHLSRQLRKLRILRLECTHITNQALEYLPRLRHLENLNLFGCLVTSVGTRHLRQIKTLRELVVPYVDDLDWLADLPQLRKLLFSYAIHNVVDFYTLTSTQLASVGRIPRLESLTLVDCRIPSFTCLPGLHQLVLENCCYAPTVLADIQTYCKELTHLELRSLTLGDDDVDYICRIPKLQDLRFMTCENLQEMAVARLSTVPSLRYISFDLCAINHQTLVSLFMIHSTWGFEWRVYEGVLEFRRCDNPKAMEWA
jgi:hypothetical protein